MEHEVCFSGITSQCNPISKLCCIRSCIASSHFHGQGLCISNALNAIISLSYSVVINTRASDVQLFFRINRKRTAVFVGDTSRQIINVFYQRLIRAKTGNPGQILIVYNFNTFTVYRCTSCNRKREIFFLRSGSPIGCRKGFCQLNLAIFQVALGSKSGERHGGDHGRSYDTSKQFLEFHVDSS